MSNRTRANNSFMIENLLAKTPVKDSGDCNQPNKRICLTPQTNGNDIGHYIRALYASAVQQQQQQQIQAFQQINCNDSYSSGYSTSTPSPTMRTRKPLGSLTNIDQQATTSQLRQKREKKEWQCTTCHKTFDRPSLLTRHVRTHTGEKPHVCDICPKAFSTSSSLNTHRRIHSGEKPHACNTCGKTFTASSNLYYHKLTHTSEKPHKCTQCAKSFATPGDLRCHMHIHDGSWPYKCTICDRGFSKQTNLKNHMLIHTGRAVFAFFLARQFDKLHVLLLFFLL